MKVYIILVLIISQSLATPNINRFQKINSDTGLSSSYVLSIVMDPYGFIWIGTSGGLNRYDGSNVITFLEEDNNPKSLKGQNISSLFVDKEGILWIGNEVGLSKYNYDTEDFTFIEEITKSKFETDRIDIITDDYLGNLWFGGKFLYKLDKSTNQLIKFPNRSITEENINYTRIKSLVCDKYNRLWISTNTGLDLYDTKSDKFIDFMKNNYKRILPNINLNALGIDKKNRIWISSFGGYLTSLNLDDFSDFKIYNLSVNESFEDQGFSKHIVSDENGNVYSANGYGGFTKYDYKTDSFTSYVRSESNTEGLNSNSVWELFIDDAGNLWVGTFGGGVNVAYKNNQAILHYSSVSGNKNSLSFNNVTDFEEDAAGNIWVCTDGGGLNKFNPKTNTFSVYTQENSGLGSNAVLDVCSGKPNEIWIANWAGGLNLLNTKSNKIKNYNTFNSNLPDNNFFSVFKDSHQRIWAGYFHGIVLYNRKEDSFIDYKLGTDGFWTLSEISEDDEGKLWISSEIGLHIFDPKTKKFTNWYTDKDYTKFIPSNWVSAVKQSDKNTYWIATKNGLCKYDKLSKTFERFSTKDGLPSNNIKSIEIDNSGLLWAGTNKGLFTFDYSNKNIELYGISDGLQGNEFRDGSSFKTDDGALYFGGTTGGFNIIHPDEMKKNKFVPNVVFTDFKLFNKSVEINGPDQLLKKSILLTDKINLNYDQSVISFDFVSLNFESSELNQYAYMLEGFDKDFIYNGHRRTVNYTNLSPGTYILHIKGSNNNNVWNETGTSLKIEITPPFWQTWWFRSLLFFVIVFGVILFINLRLRSINKRNKILEYKVRKRTEELQKIILQLKSTQSELKISNETKDKFFSIISHDLKSPFSSLLGITEMIINEFEDFTNEEILTSIKSIEKTSTAVYNLLENLLDWSRIQTGQISYSPKKFQLNTVFNNVITLLEIYAKNKGIKIINKVDDNLYVLADKNMVSTIVRNLTSNSIKFTNKKGIIEYSARCVKDKIEISVRDNGVGMDESTLEKLFRIDVHNSGIGTNNETGTGLGLILCKDLVEKQSGKIRVESKVGQGTIFTFSLNNADK